MARNRPPAGQVGSRLARVVRTGCVAGLLAGLLAGCGALPDSGPAGQGRVVQRLPDEPVQPIRSGPKPGQQPRDLVVDFLRAGASSSDNYAVARQFLMGLARTGWKPRQGTLVHDGRSLTVVGRRTGGTWTMTASAAAWGRVDARGRLTLLPPGTRSRTELRLEQRAGQWRINELSPEFGLWMDRDVFDDTHTPLRLFYVAAGSRLLVPDLRWFAGSTAVRTTSLVQQLLAGPPADLAAAVVTGFPPGTRLAVDAVPTRGGNATVDLSEEALRADPQQRQHLWAQLRTTLRQLRPVSRITITVDGVPYRVPGVGSDQSLDDAGGYTEEVPLSRPVLALRAGRLVPLDLGRGEPTRSLAEGPDDVPDVSGLRSVTEATASDLLVGVDASGSRLLRVSAGAGRTVLAAAPGLLDPVVDRSAWVWTASTPRPGALLLCLVQPSSAGPASGAVPSAGDPSRATAPLVSRDGPVAEAPRWLLPPWLVGRAVVSLDVSRDGARVAVVSTADGRARLDVAGVQRDGGGRPVALTVPRTVAQSLVGVHDVSWASPTHLVVLATGSAAPDQQSSPLRPHEVEVGGLVTDLPVLPGAQAVWAGAGLSSVLVRDDQGRLLVRSGAGWRSVGTGSSVSVAP